ncbi:tyrosine-protein phosphatase [Jannaschia sp. CCS1]|uniref:phosphatase domain-containing putative toxin n=1 Tax=Jannaschia sp. (strain CCS1) TaxID=290400 RepID=UPI00031A94BA|nr:tyrosine-protein phosphatase [Jannaschia sp. CCS1]
MDSDGYEIETHVGRRRAMRYHFWIDHEILRYPWTNFDEIAPGVFRSNHPTRARFKAYAERGIKTILTLRGGEDRPHHLLEVEACRDFGLTFECVPMSARHAPTVAQLSAVFEVLDRIERPFLIHCKSGADRTGLVSAIYLMHYENIPFDQARVQLSFRYIHIRRSQTGILDVFLEAFAARHAETGIGIRDWIMTEYDEAALTASFDQRQRNLWPWEGWRSGVS